MPGPPPVSEAAADFVLNLTGLFVLFTRAGLTRVWFPVRRILQRNISLLRPRNPDDWTRLHVVEHLVYAGDFMTEYERSQFRSLCDYLDDTEKTDDGVYDQVPYFMTKGDDQANFIVTISNRSSIFLGGEVKAKDLNFLRMHRVTHIVNAAMNVVNPQFVGIKQFRFDIGGLGRTVTQNRYPPREIILPELERLFAFIEDAIASDGNVYVHCRYGKHRGAGVLFLILMRFKSHTFTTAVEYVTAQRPCVEVRGEIGPFCRYAEGLITETETCRR